MRRLAPLILLALLAAPAAASPGGRARCDAAVPAAPAGLPATVVASTRCGEFLIRPDGRVERREPRAFVPRGRTWTIRGGRLVVVDGTHVIWRSRGRHRFIAGADVWRDRVAFATYERGKLGPLYLARIGGVERAVGAEEHVVAWTRRGDLVTARWRRGSGDLRVRRNGTGPARILSPSSVFGFDVARRELYVVTRAALIRTDGRRRDVLTALAPLAFDGRPWPSVLASRHVALQTNARLVVVDARGRVVSSTALPQGRRVGVSAGPVLGASVRSVAFAVADGETSDGKEDTESVFVLAPGERRAREIDRHRLFIEGCARGASLAWRGRWLLYSTTEGRAVAYDTASAERVDLTPFLEQLPGARGADGRLERLGVSWASG